MSNFGNWLRDYIAGWIGGIAGLLTGHPFETVKIRQQTKGDPLIKTVTLTYTREGFRGFYKGMGFPLFTVGILNSIYFGVYSNVLRLMQQNYESNKRLVLTNPSWRSQVFTAGVVGGFVQVLFSCPVEVVKSKLQVNTGSVLEMYWKLNYPKASFACENTLATVRYIYANKGLKGFYSGLGAMMWRDVFASGIYILSYEMLLNDVFPTYFPKYKDKQLITGMVAGGIAGVTSWGLCVPFDVVKSRLQTDDEKNPKYKGTWDCVMKIYKTEGLVTFKKGFLPIVIRAFVSNALIFYTYEQSADLLAEYVI